MTGYAGIGENEGQDSNLDLSANRIYVGRAFTANTSGSVTSLHVHINSNIAASNLRIGLYETATSTYNLVAQTGSIAFATGDVSATVSGSVTNGGTYRMAFICDGDLRISIRTTGGSGASSVNYTAQAFGAMPSTLAYGSYVGTQDMLLWPEGGAAAVAKPKLLAHSRRRRDS